MDLSMFPDVPELDDETFGPGAVQALNEDKLKDLNTLYIAEITTALQYSPRSLDTIKTQYDEDYFNIFQSDNSTYEEKYDRFNELVLTAKKQNNVFNRGGTVRRKRSNSKRSNSKRSKSKRSKTNRTKKNKRANNNSTKKSKRSNNKRSNNKRSNKKRTKKNKRSKRN